MVVLIAHQLMMSPPQCSVTQTKIVRFFLSSAWLVRGLVCVPLVALPCIMRSSGQKVKVGLRVSHFSSLLFSKEVQQAMCSKTEFLCAFSFILSRDLLLNQNLVARRVNSKWKCYVGSVCGVQ